MNTGKTIPQGLNLFRLEARRGDERRHGRRVGGGDDAHLRGEGRIAGADEVPGVSIQRADINVARDERLDDAARVHEAADDFPVFRFRVLRQQQAAESEVARLRVFQGVARDAAEGVVEGLEFRVGAHREVAHVDRLAAVARQAGKRCGQHDGRGCAQRSGQAAHLHHAQVVVRPELGQQLRRRVLREFHRHAGGFRHPADHRAPGFGRSRRHGIHAGVGKQGQSALMFALRTTSPQ